MDSVSDTVVAAVVRLEVVDYVSTLTSDDLNLYDVCIDPTILEQSITGAIGIFDDLGTGTRYAQIDEFTLP